MVAQVRHVALWEWYMFGGGCRVVNMHLVYLAALIAGWQSLLDALPITVYVPYGL